MAYNISTGLLVVRQGTTQNIVSGTDIIFNTILFQNGISYNTTTGVATLIANQTYMLDSGLDFNGMGGTGLFVQWQYVNDPANTTLGSAQPFEAIAVTNPSNNADASGNVMIYTPTTNETIKCRCTSDGSSGAGNTLRSDLQSYFQISLILN